MCDKYSIPQWLQRLGINIYMCDRGLVGVSIGVCVCDKGKERESMSTQRFAEAMYSKTID